MTPPRAMLSALRALGHGRRFPIDAQYHDADDPLVPSADDSTLVQWHDPPLDPTVATDSLSRELDFESTDPANVERFAPRRLPGERRFRDIGSALAGMQPSAEIEPALTVEFGTHESSLFGEVVFPASHALGSWLAPIQRPLAVHRVQNEQEPYRWLVEHVVPRQTLVWDFQDSLHTPVGLDPSSWYVDPQHAPGLWHWERVPEPSAAVHHASSVTYLDSYAEDLVAASYRPFLPSAELFDRALLGAQEHVPSEVLSMVASVQPRHGAVYPAVIPQFVPLSARHSLGDLYVRTCANVLAGAGLSVLGERVVELRDLVREEGDYFELRSLGFACDFLVAHRELGLPQLSVTPRGELQALWRHVAERALVVMDFLPDASVRYAALATDRHPALHSDSTRGLAPAALVMDELDAFLRDLGS